MLIHLLQIILLKLLIMHPLEASHNTYQLHHLELTCTNIHDVDFDADQMFTHVSQI